jgi:PHD/YefM family antitoxin component YafN of YafNO toxin-antitoxin module
MLNIRRKIVTDEKKRPVAVMIDYEDWEKIEKLLQEKESAKSAPSIAQFAGVLRLTEEPLSYQHRVRHEWG